MEKMNEHIMTIIMSMMNDLAKRNSTKSLWRYKGTLPVLQFVYNLQSTNIPINLYTIPIVEYITVRIRETYILIQYMYSKHSYWHNIVMPINKYLSIIIFLYL